VPFFERLKRGTKPSRRMSRTKAFLKYAEEPPAEVLVAIDDKTDALSRRRSSATVHAGRL
jgi:hypothetical protein